MPSRRSQMRGTSRGFAGIVVHHPKSEVNVGTLWRSAFLYGAAFIGTVGRRYEKQASDTPNTAGKVPLFHYADVDDLRAHLPFSTPLIGIELHPTATPLNKFWHPPNACYLLGAEDRGLSPAVLAKCHQIVTIPSAEPWSMNVATAGSIVLYDRYMQEMR